MDLADLWPPAGLRVQHDDLELRFLDDDLLLRLADLARSGVHAEDRMPFAFPWTRGTPDEVARSVLRYQWATRAHVDPDDWRLELAVLVGGELVGVQGAVATKYPVTRTAETGSWLGLRFHGAGIGTRMRLAMLHLLFDGLGAQEATTGAFTDNAASLAVTRKLGYLASGRRRLAREGEVAESLSFSMSVEQWRARPATMRPPVTITGAEAVAELLGVA
ncbi:succinyl-CoA transferase Rv0802c [Cellulomonas chitinilytica]|uniref:Succinyl-CoA transferase Rv0802c n=1 Tax=Cellulomonas chitinilytica TaxID=398759 RepID=A0A919P2K1_9CELL|nr:GNAT family protein [Cellulomonas chitinilytica]GIG20728.1 succinyl-CoA transferase Rv0802c [Cellulomonas chitinilytica]